MPKIPTELQHQILTYCQTVAPFEGCGLVLWDSQTCEPFFFPCRKVASDPENYFEISPEEIIQAEQQGSVIAVVHSHPNGEARLSIADRQMQDMLQWDFWLVCEGKLHIFPKILPLVGRDFVHGKTDCYSIIKDFYCLSGAGLSEFERIEDWWEKGGNLYLENIEGQGFKRLNADEDLQIGDVILMQVGADVPNHAGGYLGDQIVLHHSPKRLSKRDLYDGYWLKHTHSIWRHTNREALDFSIPINTNTR